jgi:hypothetical protein
MEENVRAKKRVWRTLIARLSDCFRVENLSEDGARRAYRLLALALLGQEQVVEAKLVIIQLLGLIPTYQPDPIQDSPTYSALIGEVLEALRVPSRCSAELAGAEPSYLAGAYGDVVSRLSGCFEKGKLAPEDARRAYRLLALAHLNLGQLMEAKKAVVDLLALQPGYEPDRGTDPPFYTALVAIIKRQQ